MSEFGIREISMEELNDAGIELTEQELSGITGGRGKTSEKPREFIKITMSNIIVSDY